MKVRGAAALLIDVIVDAYDLLFGDVESALYSSILRVRCFRLVAATMSRYARGVRRTRCSSPFASRTST